VAVGRLRVRSDDFVSSSKSLGKRQFIERQLQPCPTVQRSTAISRPAQPANSGFILASASNAPTSLLPFGVLGRSSNAQNFSGIMYLGR